MAVSASPTVSSTSAEDPDDLGAALDRAFAVSERDRVPYLVNVVTDPANAYPRTSNLG